MLLIKGAFAKERFWIKIFLFIFLSTFGLLVGGVLSYVLFQKNQDINSLRWSQFIISICCFALPALSAALIFHTPGGSYLRVNRIPSALFILFALLAMLLLQPFINLISAWNAQLRLPEAWAGLYRAMQSMEETADVLTQKFLSANGLTGLLSNLFFLALIPAITEELFFRGALLRMLEEKLGVNGSVWVVAVIFSTYHMQFFGFVPRMLLGALLGYILVWSGSIYLSMLAHFINNAALIVFSYLSFNKYIAFDVERLGVAPGQWWLTLVCLAIALPMVYFMYKKSKAGGVDTQNLK